MSNPVTRASSKIGNASIVIELIDSSDTRATVTVTWPKQLFSISDRRFPDFAASITRLFANASIELARIKAGGRR
jgi:hypothetical protein